MIKKYAGRLLITSISLFVCSLCHLVWKQVLKFSEILDKVGSVGKDNFNINDIYDWLGLLSSQSQSASIHKLSLGIVVPLELICGVIGIRFAAERFTKHDWGMFNIIPIIFGAAISLIGAVSFVLLAVSGKAVIMTLLLLALTLVAIPVMYLVIAVKFFLRK